MYIEQERHKEFVYWFREFVLKLFEQAWMKNDNLRSVQGSWNNLLIIIQQYSMYFTLKKYGLLEPFGPNELKTLKRMP